MNRRKFCLSSIAAAIPGAAVGFTGRPAGGAVAALPAAPSPSVRLYRFVHDRRYPAALAFGVAAERAISGAGVVAIDGDITALWSRDLKAKWSAGSGAIAGMTSARTLFCLEQLAQDHWMRVAVRVEHLMSDGYALAHRVTGSEPMMPRIAAALAAADWPARIPAALATCRADRAPRSTRVIGSPWPSAMSHEMLVSFVIA